MKFLYIFHRFHTNQYFATKNLIEHGHEVKYLVKYKDLAEDYTYIDPDVLPNARFFWIFYNLLNFFRGGNLHRDVWKYYGVPNPIIFYKKIKEYQPDFVIVRDFSFTSILAMFLCKIAKVNCVSYSSRPKHKHKKSITIKAKIFEIGQEVGIFPGMLITPVLGESGAETVTKDHIHYVPHSVDIQEGAEDKNFFKDGYINILTIGKYSLPRKNLLLMLKAFNRLKDKYKIRLTVIGSYKGGDRDSEHGFKLLNDFIEQEKLYDLVELRVNMPFAEVLREYLNHDLYVFPSSNEPNGVSHLEAMACGLPVICSDTNGTKNYINEGVNGYVFKSDDLDDLVEKIEDLISDKEKILKFGRSSLAIVEKEFVSDVVGEKFLRILKKEMKK